jgi:thiol-disulfide isomerase/thioredoxin
MAKKFRDRAIVVAIALVALAGGYLAYSVPASRDPNLADLLAANFSDLQGKNAKVADWHGKLRVVNFWATWCPPCREEIPGFIRLQNKYRDRGVVFIGVALDSEQQVKRFAAETGMNYPILLADYNAVKLAKEAGNSSGALPFTVLVAPGGSFLQAFSGAVNEQKIEAVIQRFL